MLITDQLTNIALHRIQNSCNYLPQPSKSDQQIYIQRKILNWNWNRSRIQIFQRQRSHSETTTTENTHQLKVDILITTTLPQSGQATTNAISQKPTTMPQYAKIDYGNQFKYSKGCCDITSAPRCSTTETSFWYWIALPAWKYNCYIALIPTVMPFTGYNFACGPKDNEPCDDLNSPGIEEKQFYLLGR